MNISFSRSEAEYIVNNPETDLMLTRVGGALVDPLDQDWGAIELNVSDSDFQEFLESLREDYIWKIQRLPDPGPLESLAKRLLPDYDSLDPIAFG
jgi:hypothetical protein